GDSQLRGSLRHPQHAPRVRRERVQRARRLRLLVRQRLLGRHRRDEPLRQREETHYPHQAGGLTMAAIPGNASASGTLRVLSGLLGYPDAGMRACLPDMRAILRAETALSAARVSELEALIESLAGGDPLATEATYVALFDRGRA